VPSFLRHGTGELTWRKNDVGETHIASKTAQKDPTSQDAGPQSFMYQFLF